MSEETTNEGTSTNEDVSTLRAEIEALKSKHTELLTEKAKWRNSEKLAKDAADAAAASAAEKTGDIDVLKSNYAKEKEALLAERDTFAGELRNFKRDNAIKGALTEGNVRPELLPIVEAFLRERVQFDEGNPVIEGKSIGDFAKSYLASKDGLHLVRAPDNSGGGASGAGNTEATGTITAENFNITDFMAMARENPEKANALAIKLGKPYRV